jgi:PAS domain S-box-containing protein
MPKAKAKRSTDHELLHEAQTRAAAEKLFHNLLDAAPDAILEVDSSGRIVRANDTVEELFGYNPTELLNQPVERLIPEQARPVHAKHRAGYAVHPTKRAMGSNLDLYALRKDGTRFAVDIVLSPFQTESGELHTAAIVRDITLRKQAESELKEARKLAEAANQAKSDFLASMSHELRSPLNTIMGYTQLLTEEAVGVLNDKQRRFLGHIAKDSQHLLNLINDILDLSKIEAGRLELLREACELQLLFDDVLAMILPLAAAKQIRIEHEKHAGGVVWGDPLRAKQAIVNLLSNAVKFTPSGGLVTVSARQMHNQVAITVADTGVGIPEEHRAAIFNRFHQLGVTTSGAREGTGLGLAITKSLVEQMGGRIWVESEVDRGSRFTFTLDGRLSSQPAAAKVLVVEDQPMAAELIRDFLQPEGYEVSASDSVEHAVSAIGVDRPDVILLDLRMPGQPSQGLDLLRWLKGNQSTRTIPVIVVSVVEPSASSAKELGAVAHLTKPLQKQALLDALKDVVPSA